MKRFAETSSDLVRSNLAWRGRTLLLLLPSLLIVVGLFGGGLILGLMQAAGYFPGSGAESFTLEHFKNVFIHPDFFSSLLLTFYVSATSTLLAVVFSLISALLVMSMLRRFNWLHLVMQIPLVVPHLLIATAILFLLSPTGFLSRLAHALQLIESPAGFPVLIHDPWLLGVILVYVWKEIPFLTLMLLSVLLNLDTRLLQVGKTLKANRWQRFRFIIFPSIFPSLSAGTLIVFAYSFGAFEVPYLLGQTYPMTLPVWAYRQYSDIDLMSRPEGIAAGLVIALVILLFVFIAYALVKKSASGRLPI
ncbi:MAG: ABC transporter permease subunit [candidate division KSB1 bacterium]|nr:ABC transporter permease subunit [candidate division KSB1 bacterium]